MADSNIVSTAPKTSKEELRLLTVAVWGANGNEGDCPREKMPTFRQLDDLISITAWGTEAREEFFSRWAIVEKATDKRFEVGSFAELAHLVWEDTTGTSPKLKHPLAPLILAWQSGPTEVQAVRAADGCLRADAIMPRVAMRRQLNSGTDRLYLAPAYSGSDSEGTQVALPGFQDGRPTGRVPVLPVNLYDLGVEAGARRGGHGGAWNADRCSNARQTYRCSVQLRSAQ